ncbi:MAG: GGDEF domain-containing protein [Sedimentibacter sp.]|uniref:sensor domain-containing diguanylate cyclase n=1 Tax=Sedimentibacter sp. TaxID=1960295 RepID=UPI0031587BE0
MKSINLVVKSCEELTKLVNTSEMDTLSKTANSILIQIFTSVIDKNWVKDIECILHEKFPDSVIVGASTGGEIGHGELFTNSTVVSLSFFVKTALKSFILDVENANEDHLGKQLRQEIESSCSNIAGVLLFTTPITMNTSDFLSGFSGAECSYPVFGGGAGDYGYILKSLIFHGDRYLSKGVAAVVLISDHLKIETHTCLGWEPLSKKMTITEVDGLWVKKIDNKPAFSVYQGYLNIQNDENFFLNVLEFPMMLIRDDELYARVPEAVNEDNALLFPGGLKKGEAVIIGYGNPSIIIERSREVHKIMDAFNPESIFLYSCINRRFLLQNEVNNETKPFESIAPAAGFYTHGEIYSNHGKVNLLNTTLVAVGMKEFDKERKSNEFDLQGDNHASLNEDPLNSQHYRIISRLINFIKVVNEELEEANKAAVRLAETDYLTQVYNRIKASVIMEKITQQCDQFGDDFSLALLDVDLFKNVNDNFGHNVGDMVLVNIVKVIEKHIRGTDILARWGGEEFLLAMPNTGLEGAVIVAERIRTAIEQTVFPEVGHQTCSFGVSTFRTGEKIDDVIERADTALYSAKRKGRNLVVSL